MSALQFGGGPLRFIEQARAGDFRLATSTAIRTEIRRVLHEKFAWPDADVTDALHDLDACSVFVEPLATLSVIKEDPTDDRVIECAVAAGSRYIVSGDNHLLRLGTWHDIRIVKVADFLRLLSE